MRAESRRHSSEALIVPYRSIPSRDSTPVHSSLVPCSLRSSGRIRFAPASASLGARRRHQSAIPPGRGCRVESRARGPRPRDRGDGSDVCARWRSPAPESSRDSSLPETAPIQATPGIAAIHPRQERETQHAPWEGDRIPRRRTGPRGSRHRVSPARSPPPAPGARAEAATAPRASSCSNVRFAG